MWWVVLAVRSLGLRAVEHVVGRDVDQVYVQLFTDSREPSRDLGIERVDQTLAIATLGLGRVYLGARGQVQHHPGTTLVQERGDRVRVEHVQLGVRWCEDVEVSVPQPKHARPHQA